MICPVCRANRGLLFREGCCSSCWAWIRALYANRHRLRTALEMATGETK